MWLASGKARCFSFGTRMMMKTRSNVSRVGDAAAATTKRSGRWRTAQ